LITSIAGGQLHEPSLLFDETRSRFRSARRTSIVSRTAKQLDRSVGIEFTQLLPVNSLEVLARELPRLDPPLAESNLIRCPIGESRWLIVHAARIMECRAI
jgi:hypothetical protein